MIIEIKGEEIESSNTAFLGCKESIQVIPEALKDGLTDSLKKLNLDPERIYCIYYIIADLGEINER